MTTKEVIRTTSTISKRWQHLWTPLPNLTFIDEDDVTCRRYCKGGRFVRDHTKYFSLIDKTLIQCPTDVKLNKFKLHILYDSKINTRPTSQVNKWIRYAITRNVQEVDLKIRERNSNFDDGQFSYEDDLFFNNSCITSMVISDCLLNPPNGVRWDKLKFLCISERNLDKDYLEKILSGSPCLKTLELNNCIVWRNQFKSLFEYFVVERLSCDLETYKRFSDDSYDDEYYMSMKLSRCEFNTPNVVIHWDKLKFLCISDGKLEEDVIGKILSRSPCLETLELDNCYGVRRIDITSKRFKNLVLSNHGLMSSGENYIDIIEINAPYMLSLTIKNNLYLVKLLLVNVSSLVKAELDYLIHYRFAETRGRLEYDIAEELLGGLLSSLGHVDEITLGYYCLNYLSRLRGKKDFQLFRVGADADEDRIPELIASGEKQRAVAAEREKLTIAAAAAAAAKTKKKVKVEEKEESDDDIGLMSLFD